MNNQTYRTKSFCKIDDATIKVIRDDQIKRQQYLLKENNNEETIAKVYIDKEHKDEEIANQIRSATTMARYVPNKMSNMTKKKPQNAIEY